MSRKKVAIKDVQAAKPCVVIGPVGTVLDAGRGPKRWSRWRPTVSLCQHEDLLVSRLELIHDRRSTNLAKGLVEDVRSVSPETEVRGHVVSISDPWDFEEVYAALHEFARGYGFRPEDEDYLFHITTGTHVAQICTFLLTESRHFPGRLIQTSPPARERPEECGTYRIIDLDLSRYDRIAARFEREHKTAVASLKSGIQTRNEKFNRLIERIEHVAIRTADPILLTGPTGAGKSRLAARIYELRRTRHLVRGSFVEVNCATVRGDAAMSALFGHKKGAFTGAAADREGLLRAADGGVLFLDEIGELGLDEQAMLLRALEEKRFLPLGADREVSSDFQLIAGTNRELVAQVREGVFREDLLARINLWTFDLPALRERAEDIEPNVEYELEQFARRAGHLVRFSAEARERFMRFAIGADAAWLGNFRDLSAAITRMATLAPGGRITEEVAAEEIERLQRAWAQPGGPAGDVAGLEELFEPEALADIDLFDRVQLAAVARVCRECRSLSEAGRRLFAASRKRRSSTNDADRLRKYLARFGLEWERLVDGGARRNFEARARL